MTLIDQIRDMIAKGETEKSLNELYNYVRENNADIIDNLVMLRSRMQRLQSQKLNGTIDNADEAIEQAKINEAILKLLPQLTPEYLAQANQSIKPMPHAVMSEKASAVPASNRKKIYIIGGALLLVVIILILVINGSESSNNDFQDDFAQQELTGVENQTPQENSLLSTVLANQVVWQSANNEPNKSSIFLFENDQVCQEIINGDVVHTFDVVADASDYITLHDPTRNMYLRIGETVVQFKSEGEDTWKNLYNGEWVILSDGE